MHTLLFIGYRLPLQATLEQINRKGLLQGRMEGCTHLFRPRDERRTCMLLYNSASRLAERAREIFFLILYFSLPPSFFFFFFSFSSLDLFKNPIPQTHPGLRSPFRSFPTCPSKPILPSISSAIYTNRNPVASNAMRNCPPPPPLLSFSQPIPIPFDRPNETSCPPSIPSYLPYPLLHPLESLITRSIRIIVRGR